MNRIDLSGTPQEAAEAAGLVDLGNA